MRTWLLALLTSVLTLACSSTNAETTAVDAGKDGEATMDGGAEGACCPPSPEPACCMYMGGANTDGCFQTCDSIPTDLQLGVDDAGCPYWFDPPGGSVACGPGNAMDTGVLDTAIEDARAAAEDAGPFTCGTLTCQGGQICARRASGIDTGVPSDSYECIAMPAACASRRTCGCVNGKLEPACSTTSCIVDANGRMLVGCVGV